MRLIGIIPPFAEDSFIGKIIKDPKRRILFASAASLALNAAYAIYNGVLGIIGGKRNGKIKNSKGK